MATRKYHLSRKEKEMRTQKEISKMLKKNKKEKLLSSPDSPQYCIQRAKRPWTMDVKIREFLTLCLLKFILKTVVCKPCQDD
jgi:phage terminase small subunit